MQKKMSRSEALKALAHAKGVHRYDSKNYRERWRKVDACREITNVREDRDIIVVAIDQDGSMHYRVDRF